MKQYELTFLAGPETIEGDISQIETTVVLAIKETGGNIRENKPLSRKKLEFPVKKKRGLVAITVCFEMASDRVEELEKILKQKSEIIRYLLLQKKPLKIRVFREESKKISPRTEKKVELREIEDKLEEILGNEKP